MELGIETRGTKNYCKTCGHELNMDVQNQIYNFCPFCSAPLNLIAFNFVKEKEKSIKFQAVEEIIHMTKRKEMLEILKEYLDRISIE